MRYKHFILANLGVLLSCCTTLSSKPPAVVQNPSLPAIWTPTCCSTPDLSLPDDDDIEMQMATLDIGEDAASTLITSTGEAVELRSSLPVFTGGKQWLVTIPGISWPYLASTHDGGFLLLGLQSDNEGDRQNILFRLDAKGAILWERILEPGYFHGVLEVGDGGILLVFTQSLTKLDAEGNIEWQEYLSYDQDRSPFVSSFYDFQSSQLQTSGQTVMLDSYSINLLDHHGSFINQRAMIGKSEEGQGSIWLTTQARWAAGEEGNTSIWVMKDSPYPPAWKRVFDFEEFGITVNFPEMHILGTRDGGVVFASTVRQVIRPGSAIWVVRMDHQGEILWMKTFDGVDETDLKLHETIDGGFIIASNSDSRGQNGQGNFLRVLRIDALGELLWDHSIGDGNWRVLPKAILNTSDQGFLIAGEVITSGEDILSETGDLMLLKIDQNGLVIECPWFQSVAHDPPVDRSPSSTFSTVSNTPFSTAVIYPHSYQPQNLEIRDGFDHFSTVCVFPIVEQPTPNPTPSTSFVVTPGKPFTLDDALHPIAIADGTFIGASRGENWFENYEVLDALHGALQFQLYSTDGYDREYLGTIRRAMDAGVCPGYPTIAFSNQTIDPDALALAAEWNAQPRSVSEIDPTVTTYQEILRDYLQDHGINHPVVHIDAIAKADLEGDGFEEVILTASWYKEGHLSRGVSIDDYSVIFMRQFVDGDIRTLTMIQKIHKSASGSIVPIRYHIAGILDLNGDGIMEIIIRGRSGSGTENLVIDPTHSLQVPVLQIDCANP